ncbi:adenylyl-sulfate kinase [Paenibacillus senegalensis]|uniref:adenylyl-sulfate kinase n=1 Tax=Paenibacillus senegalensis TaxID=1465766 RepID=UPI00028A00E1|nr:adenylyl-sulfate kinase [Paenibacillus senegalensis]
MQNGPVVWFTGLSGSGKTTLSREVEKMLHALSISVEALDGDTFRKHLASDLGFTRQDRHTNIERAAYVAGLLSRHRITVLASFITPYRSMHSYLREKLDPYIEIYVKSSLEECIRRDVKGLYRKSLAGEIQAFSGVTDPYEEPEHPDLILDTEQCTPEEGAREVIALLQRRQLLYTGSKS